MIKLIIISFVLIIATHSAIRNDIVPKVPVNHYLINRGSMTLFKHNFMPVILIPPHHWEECIMYSFNQSIKSTIQTLLLYGLTEVLDAHHYLDSYNKLVLSISKKEFIIKLVINLNKILIHGTKFQIYFFLNRLQESDILQIRIQIINITIWTQQMIISMLC